MCNISLRSLKILSLVTGSVFIVFTIMNIVVTWFILEEKPTRIDQINWGFQVIFVMPFLPFIFGVISENPDLLGPFFVVIVYSTFMNTGLCITVFYFDRKASAFIELVISFVCCIVLSSVSIVLISLLFKRFTEIAKEKAESATHFSVDSYSIKRFGDIRYECIFS